MRSNWPSKPMKMTFLLFYVVIFNDTRFFSTYFAVHCCLVWCVGVPQSFFTVHNECGSTFLNHSSQKKNMKPPLKFPLSSSKQVKLLKSNSCYQSLVKHTISKSLSYTYIVYVIFISEQRSQLNAKCNGQGRSHIMH